MNPLQALWRQDRFTQADTNAPIEPGDRRATGVRWRDVALITYARGPAHPAKIRLIRWLARTLTHDQILIRYAAGALIAIDPADYVGWTIFVTGCYEPASLSLVLRLMRQEPGLFIDVGAHFGWYSCAVAAADTSRVISIEPNGACGAALRRNIELNRLRNVALFTGAVGAEFGCVRMVQRAPSNSGTTAVARPDEAGGDPTSFVATVPLDDLLARVVRPSVRPVVLKLDVEGYEREVLSGLDFAGPFRPQNIIMEFAPELAGVTWGGFSGVAEFFTAKSYRLHDVLGRPLRKPQDLPEANIWARDTRG
jgi:FkbM family methyltransferase